MARLITARARDPNTASSDKEQKVWHIVTDRFGVEHSVFAECPMDAISIFKRRSNNQELNDK